MILGLKYNKVTDESLSRLSSNTDKITLSDLYFLKNRIDVATYEEIDAFLTPFLPLSGIIFGDIFWPTGQNICKWCKENKVVSYFLQHGQWIYTKNKRNPEYVPDYTFVFGTNIQTEIMSWEYGERSKVIATGSPRYDFLRKYQVSSTRDYVYFSPPVILETNPSAKPIMHDSNAHLLYQLKYLDEAFPLIVHPHYRESPQTIKFMKSLFKSAEFFDPSVNSLGLIQISQKILTHRNSTSVLDGIASKKPIILTNFADFDRSYFPKGYFGKFAAETYSAKDCFRQIEHFQGFDGHNYVEEAKPFIILGDASETIHSIMEQNVI